MKGQACSWSDLRRVKKILAEQAKLKGAYASLMRCVSKTAISASRRAIEVMEAVPISALRHVFPSHATEIGRQVKDREQWGHWIKRCEKEKWTVVQLRAHLRG